MIRQPALTAVLLALALPILGGCGPKGALKPDDQSLSQQGSDRAAIENLIRTAPEFAIDFDDGGELLGDATTATATLSGAQTAQTDSMAVLPVHWGRWRVPPNHPPARTITFLLTPDHDSALVKINVKYDGWFFVDLTDDGMRNPGKKPLRDEKTRYALFKKIWFHPDPASTDSVFGWRLAALSPSEFTMIDPTRQTVEIHSVELTGAHTHITITDPAALISLGRTPNLLPLFQERETVKVEASVTNTDHGYQPPTFVYLHVPIGDRAFFGPHDWERILMSDDGTHGDSAAGDGVFTAMWTVRDVGRHHIGIDVLNSRCLQNQTDDDYNSTTWGVPYAAFPSYLPMVASP